MDNDRSVPAAPRYHPAAQGFTGDALDQLCKSRFTEGVEVGRAEAAEAAMQVIEEREDKAREVGYGAGLENGRNQATKETRAVVTSALMPLVVDLREKLEEVRDAAKPGSAQRAGLEEACGRLEGLRARIVRG
jgi:flagellar biosynthesis/type III secretory pathway protein FliH